MDIRGLMVIGLVVFAILIAIGFVKKITKLIIMTVGIVILIWGVMAVLPAGMKAGVDLSLTLTGAKVFKTIPEDSAELLKSGFIRLTPTDKFSFAYPKYMTVRDAPPVTPDNVHDFDMDFFTTTKVYEGVEIKYFPKDLEKIKAILHKNGI